MIKYNGINYSKLLKLNGTMLMFSNIIDGNEKIFAEGIDIPTKPKRLAKYTDDYAKVDIQCGKLCTKITINGESFEKHVIEIKKVNSQYDDIVRRVIESIKKNRVQFIVDVK